MRLDGVTRSLEKRPFLAWLLVAVYAALIFYFSSQPYPLEALLGEEQPNFVTFTIHIVEYSILGFLLFSAFRSNEKTRKSAFALASIAAALYGATDELHQLFVPHRSSSLWDLLADSLGSILGAFAG